MRLAIFFTLFFLSCSTVKVTDNITDSQKMERNLAEENSSEDLPIQAYGEYAKRGKLRNASEVPMNGKGFVKLFQPRGNHYGTREIKAMIFYLGNKIHSELPYSERLQIGDISRRTGGKLCGDVAEGCNHLSHQNGLEFDAIYLKNNHKEQDLSYQDGFKEDFTREGRVSPNFNVDGNFKLFKWAVQRGNVARIFVSPVIKRRLCRYARETEDSNGVALIQSKEIQETLRRLRPWRKHDDHFHLRLKCPANALSCENQPEVQKGTGCDERSLRKED